MGIWFCIITDSNWPKVRDNRLYGVPETKRSYNQIIKTKPGDVLIFYVRSPVKAIVGMYEVTSEVFEEREYFPWEDRLYPYRVHIKPLSEDLKELSEPIPLNVIVGNVSKIRSGRALMGRSMVSLTIEDFKLIKSLIRREKK